MSSSIAYNRFGLGRRATEPDLDDPIAWLLAQISPAVPLAPAVGEQPTGVAMLAVLQAHRQARREAKQAGKEAEQAQATNLTHYYIEQMGARLQSALITKVPFAERLVHFWSNHFAISADKQKVCTLAGPFEAEAIRPHVGGTFADMLLAVVQHPAMILYLDNEQSIGPNSPAALRRAARRNLGLNENLAREILELHTLGVRSVYTQADVTELARAITGWSVATQASSELLQGMAGKHGFAYYPARHEPGKRTVLGSTYTSEDMSQAVEILKKLATHPATARHLATKLARHFIADDPPGSAIAKLEKSFLENDGRLSAVYRTLVTLPEAWQPEMRKFKTPWEYMISALRLTNVPRVDARRAVQSLRAMGQPPMTPGSPAGWADVAQRWISSDGIAKRLSFAAILSQRAPSSFDARQLATKLFGPALSETTATELERAESGTQAMTLLLASPEFMRR